MVVASASGATATRHDALLVWLWCQSAGALRRRLPGENSLPARRWHSGPARCCGRLAMWPASCARCASRTLAWRCRRDRVSRAWPASVGTARRVNEFWNTPSFGDQDWTSTAIGFGPVLRRGARPRLRRSGPDSEASGMVLAGQKVVYLHPTPPSTALDVERLYGHGDAERKGPDRPIRDPRELAA